MMRTRFIALIAALTFGVTPPALAAIPNVPCLHPVVFPDADVNVVVLPYSYAPGTIGANPTLVRRLTGLVQFETLLSIARYGNVGVVQLIGDPQAECTPDTVLGKLTGKINGGSARARSGKGLVLLWGRIYTAEEQLYVQSYVRFARLNIPETVEVAVGTAHLLASASSQSFAFPPQQFTLTDFDVISRQYVEMLRVRRTIEGPDIGSIPEDAIAYAVSEISGDWLRLVPFGGQGPTGWIRARNATEAGTLRSHMPEMAFIEGVSGFLAYRVRRDANVRPDTSTLIAAEGAMREYLRRIEGERVEAISESTPLARLVPYELLAMAAFLKGAGHDVALDGLATAIGDGPYDAAAVNMDVAFRVYVWSTSRDSSEDLKAQSSRLLAAAGSEPDNRILLGNLASLYALLLGPQPPGTSAWTLTAEERAGMQSQLTALRRFNTSR